MKVFLTGATGFLGSRIAALLVEAGHDVLGLARSEVSAVKLRAAGVEPVIGDLADASLLSSALAASDGVIHTAFDHDLSRFAEAVATEKRAVAAMLDALAGTGRPFILSSGAGVLGDTGDQVVDDTDLARQHGPDASGRLAIERDVLTAGRDLGVRSVLVRLPLFVYGDGGSVFVPALIRAARTSGVSGFIEEGANLYSAVHAADAARLYTLALNRSPEGGVLYHASAERGISARAIAGAVGRLTGAEITSISGDRAVDLWGGWLAGMMAISNQTLSPRATRDLGWRPEPGASLLDDIEHGSYKTLSVR